MFNPPKMIRCDSILKDRELFNELQLFYFKRGLSFLHNTSSKGGFERVQKKWLCSVVLMYCIFNIPKGCIFNPSPPPPYLEYLELWFNFCMLELFVIMIISVGRKKKSPCIWTWFLQTEYGYYQQQFPMSFISQLPVELGMRLVGRTSLKLHKNLVSALRTFLTGTCVPHYAIFCPFLPIF